MKKYFNVLLIIVAIFVIGLILSSSVSETVEVSKKLKYVDNKIITEEEFDFVSKNEIIVGRMSGYGPDCYGCSGYLAYGMYVGDGTIYYNDSEYGLVRIVAGDRKYPFGTIIKVNNSFLAIVLDRGGAIGIGKSFLFDLLYPNENIANENGILIDAEFEILRNGF